MTRREDDAVRAFIAEDAQAFRRRHPDSRHAASPATSSEPARVIVARHSGRCATCRRGFAAGARILWAPGESRHLDCAKAAAGFVAQVGELLDVVDHAGGRT